VIIEKDHTNKEIAKQAYLGLTMKNLNELGDKIITIIGSWCYLML